MVVVMIEVKGGVEFLSDWGEQSEISRDNIYTGAQLSMSSAKRTERKVQ